LSYHYDAATDRTVVLGNTDADSTAEFQLTFEGHINFTANDFLL
jgi:hypothetical protein